MSRKRCKSKNIRASTDEENQTSVWQDPKFVIGIAFVGTVIVVLISIFLYKLIQRKKKRSSSTGFNPDSELDDSDETSIGGVTYTQFQTAENPVPHETFDGWWMT